MDEQEPTLASLSLTHVRYDPTDPLSYACAYLALVPQGLCVVYASLMWSTREIEIIMMFVGQMASEAVNFVLKRWIREERPRELIGKGYGMPSSHSQFVTFFSVYLTLFIFFRHQPPHPPTHPTNTSFLTTLITVHFLAPKHHKYILSFLALVSAGAVCMSRIHLSYHTPKQVLAGVLAGFVFAIIWFGFTAWMRSSGLLDRVLDWEICRALRVRDLICFEVDLVEGGWRQWCEKRDQRRTKKDKAKEKDSGRIPVLTPNIVAGGKTSGELGRKRK